MSLIEWLRPWKTVPPAAVTAEPIVEYLVDQLDGWSPEELWRGQPHLRTVVDFTARQVAQLGIHTYLRDDDGGRTRQRTSRLASLMSTPSPDQTTYELVRDIVCDLALYDTAYLLVITTPSGDQLRPLRPSWVEASEKTPFAVTRFLVRFPGAASAVEVPGESIIIFHGWNPSNPLRGVSPVRALKAVLADQMKAYQFRDQVWSRGGRVNAYITRPATAPGMSPEARTKFQRQFNAAWTGGGTRAGGVPFLDEGAELKRLGFSAKEEQWLESTQLSLRTCAAVYHVNPSMVGDTAGISYANVREFRKMLYGETLGPLLMMIEQRLNHSLRELAEPGEYIQFNVEARLRGDAEEQASVLQTGIGGPYMTINEGRARLNMPSVEGGDDLIRPLNVTAPGDTDPVPAEQEERGAGIIWPTPVADRGDE